VRNRLIAITAVAVTAALLPALPAAARLGPTWAAGPDFSSPPGTTGAEWRDVSATGPADVWAVGVLRNLTDNPLTAHWDGKSWTAAPISTPSTVLRYDLTAVDTVAPDDVWVVGSAISATRTAVVLHYNGAWTPVALPQQPVGQTSTLTDVDMSATDGWAVGYTAARGKPSRALIERRKGASWVEVAAPATDATATELSAVYARAADDVWAAGSQVRVDGHRTALILHWDGVGWRQVSPEVGGPDEAVFLTSVSASTADDVWAAGRLCSTVDIVESCRPLALHLSGGAWAAVPMTGDETELTEVLAFSPDDVWVVGYVDDTLALDTDSAEHWDGHTFTPDTDIPSAQGGAELNGEPASALSAATAIPGTGAIWAVGWTGDPVLGDTHVVHRG